MLTPRSSNLKRQEVQLVNPWAIALRSKVNERIIQGDEVSPRDRRIIKDLINKIVFFEYGFLPTMIRAHEVGLKPKKNEKIFDAAFISDNLAVVAASAKLEDTDPKARRGRDKAGSIGGDRAVILEEEGDQTRITQESIRFLFDLNDEENAAAVQAVQDAVQFSQDFTDAMTRLKAEDLSLDEVPDLLVTMQQELATIKEAVQQSDAIPKEWKTGEELDLEADGFTEHVLKEAYPNQEEHLDTCMQFVLLDLKAPEKGVVKKALRERYLDRKDKIRPLLELLLQFPKTFFNTRLDWFKFIVANPTAERLAILNFLVQTFGIGQEPGFDQVLEKFLKHTFSEYDIGIILEQLQALPKTSAQTVQDELSSSQQDQKVDKHLVIAFFNVLDKFPQNNDRAQWIAWIEGKPERLYMLACTSMNTISLAIDSLKHIIENSSFSGDHYGNYYLAWHELPEEQRESFLSPFLREGADVAEMADRCKLIVSLFDSKDLKEAYQSFYDALVSLVSYCRRNTSLARYGTKFQRELGEHELYEAAESTTSQSGGVEMTDVEATPFNNDYLSMKIQVATIATALWARFPVSFRDDRVTILEGIVGWNTEKLKQFIDAMKAVNQALTDAAVPRLEHEPLSNLLNLDNFFPEEPGTRIRACLCLALGLALLAATGVLAMISLESGFLLAQKSLPLTNKMVIAGGSVAAGALVGTAAYSFKRSMSLFNPPKPGARLHELLSKESAQSRSRVHFSRVTE